jgi:hypothetical protein
MAAAVPMASTAADSAVHGDRGTLPKARSVDAFPPAEAGSVLAAPLCCDDASWLFANTGKFPDLNHAISSGDEARPKDSLRYGNRPNLSITRR